MARVKPTILARQLWGRRVAVEVKIDSGNELRSEIRSVRKALRSPALSELFVLVAKGMNAPTEIAVKTAKSKFAVSLQLSNLRKTGLLRCSSVVGLDMRRKRYEVVWEKIAQIFRQDHALELDIYENHLIVERLEEVHGTTSKPGLVISGDGKLGMVRDVICDALPPVELKQEQVHARLNQLLWEFVELFKGYLRERRFVTIREYLLGTYEELSERYTRLPRSSEMAKFFEFMDRTFSKTQPIDVVWRMYVTKTSKASPVFYKSTLSKMLVVKLFTEAGSADPARRYILNAEAQAAIRPGTVLRIYPSYTYPEP
jgi:hypothetical protein